MQLKEQYPDHIILVRAGDFYDVSGDDAEMLSSIPYFAIQYYLAQLLESGHQVVVKNGDDVQVFEKFVIDIPIVLCKATPVQQRVTHERFKTNPKRDRCERREEV